MMKEWLNLSETAELIGVHPSTVRNWADQGKIPVHRTQGGHRRFRHSEVTLWQQSQRASSPAEAQLVVQNALKYTRFQITEGRLEAESWYQKLDTEARGQYRKSGRSIMQGLVAYLSVDDIQAAAEARAIGYEYATRGRRYELGIVDATRAFLFFRNILLDAMLEAFEAAVVSSPQAWSDMYRKINAFTDGIMVTLMETYEAFDRGKPGNQSD
jgi:excisionase family DNA binding protein